MSKSWTTDVFCISIIYCFLNLVFTYFYHKLQNFHILFLQKFQILTKILAVVVACASNERGVHPHPSSPLSLHPPSPHPSSISHSFHAIIYYITIKHLSYFHRPKSASLIAGAPAKSKSFLYQLPSPPLPTLPTLPTISTLPSLPTSPLPTLYSPLPALTTLTTLTSPLSPLTSFIDVCFAVSDGLLDRGRFAKRGEVITEGDKDGTSTLVRRMEEELEEEEAWSLAHSGRPRLQVSPSSPLLTSFHLLIPFLSPLDIQ